MNLGVKPLGNKTVSSPVIQEEIRILKSFGAAIRELGAVDTEEKSKKYRQIILAHYPNKRIESLYKTLNLGF